MHLPQRISAILTFFATTSSSFNITFRGAGDLDQSQSDLTTPSPPIRTNVPMSSILRPQHVFSLHSNNTVFSFDILPEFGEQSPQVKSGNYRLSVVVERIYCFGPDNHLVLEGKGTYGEVTRSMKLCMIEDNENNGWQTVDNVLDGVSVAEVRVEGDWASWGLSAQLVVSIYREVDDGCVNCALGEFCCGLSPSLPKAKCIPGSGVCNRHPNCGLYSNLDEDEATCAPRECVGADCYLVEVAFRIAVLVVFCFLIPPTIILITCRFQSSRRIWDHCNQVLESCWRRHSSERDPHPAFCSRQAPSQSTSTYSPEDDQPPSYEDFLASRTALSVIELKDELILPPPSFDQAVSSRSTRDLGHVQGGTVNPAFSSQEDQIE